MNKLIKICAALCLTALLAGCTPSRVGSPVSNPGNQISDDEEFSIVREQLVDVITEIPFGKIGIGLETIVEYKSAKESFRKSNDSYPWLYDFNTVKAIGFGKDGTVCDIEMYCGAKAYVNNGTVYFKIYDNGGINGVKYSDAAVIEYLSIGGDYEAEAPVSTEYTELDMSGCADGLYRIRFNMNGLDLDMYFFIDGEQIMLCSVSHSAEDMDIYAWHRNDFLNAIHNDGITPENSSDHSELHYPIDLPNEDKKLFRHDEKRWIELSDTLVQFDWSDERKLLAFHDWMTENLAYDKYRWETLKESRTQATADYSGAWAMYETHTGVCHDFANVLTIMCRAQGIPAVTVDAIFGRHVWNAVYINGKWLEFDITIDVDRYVYGEDVHAVTEKSKYKYDGYFTPVFNKTIKNKEEEIYINVSLVKQGVFY